MGHQSKVLYLDWREASDATIRLGITSQNARREGIAISTMYKLRHGEDPRLPVVPAKFYTPELWKSINLWPGFTNEDKRPDVYQTIEEVETVVRKAGLLGQRDYEIFRRTKDPKLPEIIKSYYGRSEWWEKKYGGFRQLFFGHLIYPSVETQNHQA